MRLKWTAAEAADRLNKRRLDDQAAAAKKKSDDERKKLMGKDIPAAFQSAMDHLLEAGLIWPSKPTDSYVKMSDGSEVKTWWAGSSARHQVAFRVDAEGNLMTTPMRGARDIGNSRPEATPLEMEDSRFDDIQFGKDLLVGLQGLASAKLALLEAGKQEGQHK